MHKKNTLSKQAVRQKMKERRITLAPAVVAQSGPWIADQVRSLTIYQQASTIALYMPFQHEADVLTLSMLANLDGKTTCFPVLMPNNSLIFRVASSDQCLSINRYGIAEPPLSKPSIQPELVLMPLLAINEAGYRLGQGQGCYDRTLASMDKQPYLIGIGYDFQLNHQWKPQSWDLSCHKRILAPSTVLSTSHA